MSGVRTWYKSSRCGRSRVRTLVNPKLTFYNMRCLLSLVYGWLSLVSGWLFCIV
ncbi:uncharacterized protein DS421_11g327080 [Arachis hypogaea]|nr:uncharacterized protein DS421_11g327080 [Arachis hypogaea]